MAVQASANRNIIPFILSGNPLQKEGETIAQIADRSAALAPYTLMGKISATGKWAPCDDATATDGSAIPRGIYMGDSIAAASLVAGDVEDCPIIVGGSAVTFDKDQLVIEEMTSPPMTIDSVVSVGTNDQGTIRERLYALGLFAEDTIAIDAYENA